MLIKSLDKVEKLTKRVENLYNERQRYDDLQQALQARNKLINEAPQLTRTDFWCSTCREDILNCMAYKVVEKDWCYPYQKIAYYESYRACHKGLRRRITDKHTDPYYRESAMIRIQARAARDSGDLLQPHDFGFQTKYGDPNKKLYAKQEAEERANFHKKTFING